MTLDRIIAFRAASGEVACIPASLVIEVRRPRRADHGWVRLNGFNNDASQAGLNVIYFHDVDQHTDVLRQWRQWAEQTDDAPTRVRVMRRFAYGTGDL